MTTPVYLGVFLTKAARERLLGVFPAQHEKVHADHVTVSFRPSHEEVEIYPIGERVELEVVGVASDEKCQAILVSGVTSKNKHPHITISTAAGIKPVYSNELLDRGFSEVSGLRLEGVCDTFPRTTEV